MELVTQRLRLREFVPDDWRAVLAYQQEPLYLRFNPWTERTPADAQEFVGWFVAQQTATPRDKYQLAITLKRSGTLIGNCGVRRDAPESRLANMGYELAPAQWGRGYATEAARAMLAVGFTTLGAHRIEAHCVPENTGSARVLAKIGLQREGHLREVEFFKDRWWDRLVYAVLEPEWRARVALPKSEKQVFKRGFGNRWALDL